MPFIVERAAALLRIVHLALGGCLRAPPVAYGLTADTGGHIAYVLAAAAVQASWDPSADVSIVTRLFKDARLGVVHSNPLEPISPRVRIVRIATRDRRYLEKEKLAAELRCFTDCFLAWLQSAPELPSVIHAHFADAAAVAIAARERFGIPFAYTPHALGHDKAVLCGDSAETTARIIAERRAIEFADAIIVSSRDEAKRQVAAYGVAGVEGRVEIIPPGAPAQVGSQRIMTPLAFTEPRQPLVLAIARPTHKKNLVAVAEAFAESRLCEIANLVILAGQHETFPESAEERGVLAKLRDILSSPTLAGRISLPQRHTSEDIRALYALAARSGGVFVSPALHEPFGLTLLEAAAAGVPVVATINGGAADIVRIVGHGLTVDPLDRTAIASACLRVLEEPGLRSRLRNACEGYAETFSWEKYARRSTELYAALTRASAQVDAAAA